MLQQLRGLDLPVSIRIQMITTLFQGMRYVATAGFACCLTTLAFTIDHPDLASCALLAVTVCTSLYRIILIPAYHARCRRSPLDLPKSRIWSIAFTLGAMCLASCIALAYVKACFMSGTHSFEEQSIIQALALGLTTGTAVRPGVPPWTGLVTAFTLLPVLLICDFILGDKFHILFFVLLLMYLMITISSIRSTHAQFSSSIKAALEIDRLASCDKLTGLLNRLGFNRAFTDRQNHAISSATQISILLIDLDRFKYVNDTYGHATGDSLLVEVSRALEHCSRSSETIARTGGDEFIVIHEGDPADAEILASRYVKRLHQPFRIEGKTLEIGSSIGVYTSQRASQDEMIRNADFALYKAKGDGRNCYKIFAPAMRAEIDARQALEAALCGALAAGQLEVHYQFLVDMPSQDICGVEALIRWNRPGFGPVSPEVFVPLAEELGLICELGEWVLETACREVVTWPSHIRLAVNVSPAQFVSGDLPDIVFRVLARTGLPAARLELEVTEGILIDHQHGTANSDIQTLRSNGVRISLDDFGIGFSSIDYLRRFAFDKIKIDRSFIAACAADPSAKDIICAMIALAHGLKLPVVAEGVETADQVSMLDGLRCNQIQGYLFGKPMPHHEAKLHLQARKPTPRLSLVENK